MTASPAADDPGWTGLFRGGRGVHTILLNTGIGVHAIDIYVIATIMPAVVADIGGVEFYAWTTMVYMVGTIVGAAAGHYVRSVLGRRMGYVAGGMVFLGGAAGCAAAPGMALLLAFRVVEGLGGGLLMSQSMSLIHDLYEGRLRTRILAAVTTTWSVASVFGPLIGGVWSSLGWWRGAFLTTALLAVLFVAAAWRVVPKGRPGRRRGLAVRRLALLAVSVVLVGGAGHFDASAWRIALIAGGVACLWQTLRMDGRGRDALFPRRVLSLFSPVGTAYWVFLLLPASYTTLSIFMPLALLKLYGLDPLWIGYVATVFSLSWTAGSIGTAGWSDRWTRAACAGGLAITAAASAAIALAVGDAPLWTVIALMAAAGTGVGMTNVHSVSWTLAAADRDEAELVASAAPAMRSIGIAYGAAAAGLVANAAGLAGGTDPETVRAALPWVFGIGAAAPLAGSLCVLRMHALKPGVAA